jgi:hypothetical protein
MLEGISLHHGAGLCRKRKGCRNERDHLVEDNVLQTLLTIGDRSERKGGLI